MQQIRGKKALWYHTIKQLQMRIDDQVIAAERLTSFCCFFFITTTLFTKLPWPGNSEETFQSSSQAATLSTAWPKGQRCRFYDDPDRMIWAQPAP